MNAWLGLERRFVERAEVDRVLWGLLLGLMALGLLMVASASMPVAERLTDDPYFFVKRQLGYAAMGLGLILVLRLTPSEWLRRVSPWLLLATGLALLAVFVPGLGRSVNGSTRWLSLVVFQFQVSEFAKLAMVCYLAGYLVRRGDEVRAHIKGFLKPMAVISVVALLLLLQPDMGAAAVIMGTALVMMWLAGMRLSHFALLLALVSAAFALLAFAEPYRVRRIVSFLDPWADPFNSGFQLVQSLIAIGRGGLSGVGLGESIQKLHYLPEAHTDFIFAVFAEEFGLVGSLGLLALFVLFLWRLFRVAWRAERLGQWFSAYLVVGIGSWLSWQLLINLAVNMGLLPTKGLTLPLISYGGSSMLMVCAGLGLVLAVDRECAALEARDAERRLPEAAPVGFVGAHASKTNRAEKTGVSKASAPAASLESGS